MILPVLLNASVVQEGGAFARPDQVWYAEITNLFNFMTP